MKSITFEQFQSDVKNHVLKVKKDDGLYRHLLIQEPGTSCQHYNITTWPGYLCYSGDMGCFVFQRTDDMFSFFRRDVGSINAPYLAEKLESADRRDGYKEWDQEAFEEAVNERLVVWLEDNRDADEDFIAEQKDKVAALINESNEHQAHAVAALNNFDEDEGGVDFYDFWESYSDKYTNRFIWCCHAIVHAIALYDAQKANEVAA